MIGVAQLEIFTLTLTLSLKGEGISELRKSYYDSENHGNQRIRQITVQTTRLADTGRGP